MNRVLCCQIKDVASLDWKSGDHPIATDFEFQKRLFDSQGVVSELEIVVSTPAVAEKLSASKPSEINFVQVKQYDSAPSMNSLIRTNSQLRTQLTQMCALDNPSADKMEVLGTTLLGVWDAVSRNKTSLAELMDRAHGQTPHYIRGMESHISVKLTTIFESVRDFVFRVENAFIIWSYGRTDSGVLQYALGSKEFAQWENDVFNAQISNFEELEQFLSA